MQRNYAGIGSRKTPANVLLAMTGIAKELDSIGFTLRSGAAPGADQAFERGTGSKEIFLPWRGFENHPSLYTEPTEAAIALSRKLFPHFPGVSRGTRALISRNMHQVLGPILYESPPSEFVVCWTEGGKKVGGTAYALKAAEYFNIPIYNLAVEIDCIKLKILIDDMKKELISVPN